jgi:hypothetical protein
MLHRAAAMQPYLDYAKQFAVALTSLDYQAPDSGIQRILDGSIERIVPRRLRKRELRLQADGRELRSTAS